MANLTNADRIILGTETRLIGTADADLITVQPGNFLLAGTTSGLIDGLGGTDTLRLQQTTLTGTTIAGIEATVLVNSPITVIDAAQVGNLGAITQTVATSNVTLSNPAGAVADFSGLSLAANQVLSARQTTLLPGETLTVDFSGASFAAGARVVWSGGTGDEIVTGGDGNDTLGGAGGDDVLGGGAGDDTLEGGSGVNTLRGGAGDDVLNATNASGLLDGGADDDTITVLASFDDSAIDGGAGNDTLRLQQVDIEGTTIAGIEATQLVNLAIIRIDADQIGNLGTITLAGNAATIEGNLTLTAPTGATADFSGLDLGENQILDVIHNGLLAGEALTVDFSGGSFATGARVRYMGNTGREIVTGGDGGDELRGGADDDVLDGAAGDDDLDGGAGANTLRGGAGNDTLVLSNGSSGTADGGADDDLFTLLGGFQDGAIDGGAGVDTLRLQQATLTGTTVAGIESTVLVNAATITIDADQIGNLGTITLAGNAVTFGAEIQLSAPDGATADFGGLSLGATESVEVIGTLLQPGETLTVDFSGGTYAAGARTSFFGGVANETAIGGGALDDLRGATGLDTISYAGNAGGVTINLATQTVSGGAAQGDVISGFESATGAEGDDALTGSGGANVLAGGGGGDVIITGGGADVVVATVDNGDDDVTDFADGLDRVDLRRLPKDAAILAVLTAQSDGVGGTVLSFTTGGSITLQGLALADFDIGDVILEDGVYAIDDSLATDEDTALDGDVLSANPIFQVGDLEIGGGALLTAPLLSVESFTVGGETFAAGEVLALASGALFTLAADGSFAYDPGGGPGPDALKATQALNPLFADTLLEEIGYTLTNVAGDTDEGLLSIDVSAVNDLPVVAGPVFGTGVEDAAAVTIALLANAADVDAGDLLSVTGIGALPAGFSVEGATLTVDPGVAERQALNEGQQITLVVDYLVTDLNAGATAAAAQVTLTGVNDAPTLVGTTAAAVEDGPGVIVALAPLGDDADAEDTGATLAYAIVLPPTEGTASISGTTLTFAPGPAFQDLGAGQVRDVTVQVRATDARGAVSAVAGVVITLTGINDVPVAAADAYAATFDTLLAVTAAQGVLANDLDPDGDALAATLVAGPANGVLTLNPDGAFDYAPAAGFSGQDAFTYRAGDGAADGAETTVTITIGGPGNRAPIPVDDAASTDEDQPVDIAVLANDADPDGDALAVTALGAPAGGSVTDLGGGVLRYTPAAGFGGQDSFTYTVGDGRGGQATGTVRVSVTPGNDAPVAVDDAAATAVATAVTIDVLANDSDADGDALSVEAVTDGASGAVAIGLDGLLTYTPDAGFVGTDSFTYVLADGAGGTDNATVTVEVAATPGPNLIVGGPNQPRIDGTSGADAILVARSRATQVFGEAEADIFVFGLTTGDGVRDVAYIRDFEHGTDLIDLGGATFVLRRLGLGSVITLDTPDRDTLVVTGVTLSDADVTDAYTNPDLGLLV